MLIRRRGAQRRKKGMDLRDVESVEPGRRISNSANPRMRKCSEWELIEWRGD